ncbi:OmpP1/FadL family transporter [Paucibacter sp. DJ1R-11]|uniref:OmpP1/FadL family transporter n=1 Tax=Paucibacter sp. DJ1R-11 TaxID=2893556 RepID=UPI0021E49A31|nr:OmpP1/FadL family transporter [Paucibacter sp. DJ1R-11]MCV2363048.1 OmpP1/FadL family transporter [Paucibacter sp. DJ1R-11]
MKFKLSALGLAVVGSLCAQAAMASGYHFGSQSAAAQGTANANTAEASDASVLFYNPAGMTRLDGTHASGVLNVVVPRGTYTDQGSVTSFGLPIKNGNNGGTFVKATAVPHAYLTHKLDANTSVGFAFFVPFGSKSTYDESWSGRYNAIATELKTIALNPSIAYKVNEKLSLGAGVTAQHIEGVLAKAADFGSGAMGLLVEQQVAAAMAAQPGVPAAMIRAAVLNRLGGLIQNVSGNPTYSGRVDVEGKDWGVGFNLGLMYSPNEDTRFGIAYRSKISHTLKGDAKWTVATPAGNLATLLNTALPGTNAGTTVQQRLVGLYTDSAASLKVDTPESLSLSFFKQQDKLAVMADVTLTRHSRFQELRIDFANNLPDSLTPERWVKTVRGSFGLNYQWSDTVKLRGGVAFDQSPVSESNRTPSIPDNDRTWISAGMNWKLDAKNSIDFAASLIHVASSQINMYDNGAQVNAAGAPTCNAAGNTSSCATIKGRFKLSSGLLGVQYNRQF